MKPLISDGALKASLVTIGGILIAVSAALVDVPDMPFPRWAIVLAGAIGGILSGKEALKRRGDYASDELPKEWVDAVEQVNAQAQNTEAK